MREVAIVDEVRGQRRWVAVDTQTGKPVLRLHDRDLLRSICHNLGWQIVLANPQRAQGSSPA
jgi:hypothetical protein